MQLTAYKNQLNNNKIVILVNTYLKTWQLTQISFITITEIESYYINLILIAIWIMCFWLHIKTLTLIESHHKTTKWTQLICIQLVQSIKTHVWSFEVLNIYGFTYCFQKVRYVWLGNGAKAIQLVVRKLRVKLL